MTTSTATPASATSTATESEVIEAEVIETEVVEPTVEATTEETTALSVSTINPEAPNEFDEAKMLEYKAKAADMVKSVLDESDSRSIVSKFDNLGQGQQGILSQKISLLDERLNADLAQATEKETPAAKNLNELATNLDMLNPQKIKEEKVWGFLPMPAKRVMSKLKTRYSSGRDNIDKTINNLLGCREMMIKDNSQLEQLALNVDEARKGVIAQAYLGELIIEAVENELPAVTDERKEKNLKKLLHRMYTRTQDLRITEQVDLQFDAAITQMIDNNVELKDAIDRTVNVARPLLTVIMSLAIARQRQKAVQRSVETTRASLGNLLAAGAQEQKQAALEVAELANKPVVAIEKVEEAYLAYSEAMKIAEEAQTKGIEDSKLAIAQVRGMSKKMALETDEYKSDRQLELDSSK
tara:strand:+ start:5306 stop:6541 length:1236 start_codon:yes stop_codon:yes gene_type:complete